MSWVHLSSWSLWREKGHPNPNCLNWATSDSFSVLLCCIFTLAFTLLHITLQMDANVVCNSLKYFFLEALDLFFPLSQSDTIVAWVCC